MPLLGDDKTLKRLGYKKVRSKGKNTYTKDVRVKKIKINEMQSDVQKKASGGSSRFSKSELKIARAKKYLKSQGITNSREEGKMPKHVREKLEQMLRSKFKDGGKVKTKPIAEPYRPKKGDKIYFDKGGKPKLGKKAKPIAEPYRPKKGDKIYFDKGGKPKLGKKAKPIAEPYRPKKGDKIYFDKGGKVKTKKPKSRLLNPYIDFAKTKEFAKNEKAGAVVKTSKAKVGTTIGKNVDVGLIYDKQKFAKQNFTQKTKKTGVEATVAGKRGRVTFSAGKKSESNPFEGKSSGKYFNVQGRINLRAQGGLSPKQSSQMDVDKDGTISSNDLNLKREGFSRGGGIAVRGTKFNGIK